MAKVKSALLVGVGGQGAILISKIMSNGFMKAGYDVKQSEVHGMAQRGGSVVTFVRFGESVYEPVVEEGQADVVIAFERLEAQRYAHFLKKDGVLIVNDCRIDPMTVVIGAKAYPENIIECLKKEHAVYTLDGRGIALELKNAKVLNSAVLGFAARFIGFDEALWLETVESTVPQKTVAINREAFLRGYALAGK